MASILDAVGSGPGQIPWWQLLATAVPKIAGAALSAGGGKDGPTGAGMIGAGLTGIGDVMGALSDRGQQLSQNKAVQPIFEKVGKGQLTAPGAVGELIGTGRHVVEGCDRCGIRPAYQGARI